MNWLAYGLKYEKVIHIYNDGDVDEQDLLLDVDLTLTPEQSKALRKQMKAAEKAARGE